MDEPTQEQQRAQPKFSGGPPPPPKKTARDLFDSFGGRGPGQPKRPLVFNALPKWLYMPFLAVAVILTILTILGLFGMAISMFLFRNAA